jgi:hypothetical protein
MHNASAVIRSCAVFGIQKAHIIEDRFGQHLDKNIAMGAQKWVDIERYTTVKSCIHNLRGNGYKIIATTPNNDSTLLEDFKLEDKVALFFGTAIAVKGMYDPEDEKGSVDSIKEAVSSRLENLTTHIADEANYEEIAGQLNSLQVDYLRPKVVNKAISELQHTTFNSKVKRNKGILQKLFKSVFFLLNFPMVLIWKKGIKPKVLEPEFVGTFRFAFVLLAYPIYYLMLFAIMASVMSAMIASITILMLFLFNWMYVRLN